MIALDGCHIERAVDGRVEIIVADARNRSFPDRVTETLGVCVKFGPDHDVKADGRRLRYPRDAICVRPPGCVWSTPSTGPVAFVSIDIEPVLLPPGGVCGAMTFAEVADVADVRSMVRTLRSAATGLWKEGLITHLVDGLLSRGLARAPDLDRGRSPRAADRARDMLEQAVAEPPSLRALASAVGANPFVLLREFRRRFGLPPHAFLLRLRAERARTLLAKGRDLAEVAHDLGFADQSHMTRVFKRLYGLTPAAYRRTVTRVG